MVQQQKALLDDSGGPDAQSRSPSSSVLWKGLRSVSEAGVGKTSPAKHKAPSVHDSGKPEVEAEETAAAKTDEDSEEEDDVKVMASDDLAEEESGSEAHDVKQDHGSLEEEEEEADQTGVGETKGSDVVIEDMICNAMAAFQTQMTSFMASLKKSVAEVRKGEGSAASGKSSKGAPSTSNVVGPSTIEGSAPVFMSPPMKKRSSENPYGSPATNSKDDSLRTATDKGSDNQPPSLCKSPVKRTILKSPKKGILKRSPLQILRRSVSTSPKRIVMLQSPRKVTYENITTTSHKKEYNKLARRIEAEDPSIGPEMTKLWNGSMKDNVCIYLFVVSLLGCVHVDVVFNCLFDYRFCLLLSWSDFK